MPFVKGQSGNPGGRSRELKAIQEAARIHAPTALRTLAQISARGKTEAARVRASVALLDRGFGMPAQSIEHLTPVDEFGRLSDRDLLEQLSRQANEMGVNVTLTYDFGQGDENEPPKLIEGVASEG